jgi:hypothetical protein
MTSRQRDLGGFQRSTIESFLHSTRPLGRTIHLQAAPPTASLPPTSRSVIPSKIAWQSSLSTQLANRESPGAANSRGATTGAGWEVGPSRSQKPFAALTFRPPLAAVGVYTSSRRSPFKRRDHYPLTGFSTGVPPLNNLEGYISITGMCTRMEAHALPAISRHGWQLTVEYFGEGSIRAVEQARHPIPTLRERWTGLSGSPPVLVSRSRARSRESVRRCFA